MGDTLSINRASCEKAGCSLEEVLGMIFIHFSNTEFGEIRERLLADGYIYKESNTIFPVYRLSSKGVEVVNNVICMSSPVTGTPTAEDRIEKLVKELQPLLPEGKKPGTSQYWRGNKKDIARKLQQFLLRYENYSDEQIIEATRRYVASFNGNYNFMRVLQYFIWKVTAQDGKNICNSDLASFIENEGQTEYNSDWNTKII